MHIRPKGVCLLAQATLQAEARNLPAWVACVSCPRLRAGHHPRNRPPRSFPLFPTPPLQVGSEPLQMMCSDGGERRLEGMGRHKNTHTHTHARTHTLPSPEKPSSVPDLGACPPGDVMTRGEGTCVSSEGTCACARASLLACAKHGASSTTVHKKRWRVFIINEFLDIRFTHPRK